MSAEELKPTQLQDDLKALTVTYRDIPKMYQRSLDEITRLRTILHKRSKRSPNPCPCGCTENP